jgi:hypothetical protein
MGGTKSGKGNDAHDDGSAYRTQSAEAPEQFRLPFKHAKGIIWRYPIS